MKIAIKRAYERPNPRDGYRALVDRVWPRGLSKDQLKVKGWWRDLAPSAPLRKWFGHEPKRWTEFQRRYRAELRRPAARRRVRELLTAAGDHSVLTLVYSARDEQHNQAVVLREVLRAADRTRTARAASKGRA